MRQRGFTLLELLVAMGIFAIIGAMALGGLNAIVGQETIARGQMERLGKLQRAMRLMATDFSALEPRYVRDELGSSGLDAELPLKADRPFEYVVRATRGGWANPARLPHRGTLQRFQYRLDDEKLYREYWPVVDHVLGEEPRSEELLTGVRSLKILYLEDNDWLTQWPPVRGASDARGGVGRPRAIKIILELEEWGQIERLLEVPQ